MSFSPRQILSAQQLNELANNVPHAGLDYAFSATTADGDPGDGYVRINSGTWSEATEVHISKNDRSGNDLGSMLQALFITGCWLWMFSVTDRTRWFAGTITGITDNGTYWTVSISGIQSSTARADDEAIISVNALGALAQTTAATSETAATITASSPVTFTTQSALPYLPGTRLRFYSRGSGAWMEGKVTSYAGQTLTALMDLASGSGSHSDWNITVTGEPGEVVGAAPINSPTFTGTPAAPTAAPGTNSTQIATTEFVQNGLAAKAPTASPTITGTPTAPTAENGTNTEQIATTRFVQSGLAPKADASAVSSALATKANASDLSSLETTVSNLSSTVAGKASTSSLTGKVGAVKKQIFTASGTYTPSAGMIYCVIEAWGGGGGGGGITGASGNYNVGSSGGGGAGGYSRLMASAADIGASKAVTIGAAGAGGAAGNNAGSAGGETSVGIICVAKGGSGGGAGASSNAGTGGLGGVPGTGDIAAPGAPGGTGAPATNGINLYFCGGIGGSSLVGAGGRSPTGASSASAGNDATGYGAGGSGAGAHNSSNSRAGGNGTPGYVVITEYCAS